MDRMVRSGAAALVAALAAGCSSLEVSQVPTSAGDASGSAGSDAGTNLLPSADAGLGASCPSGAFLDVRHAAGAGANYPDPDLEVSCDEEAIIVRSNGVPHYRLVQVTPEPLIAQERVRRIPRMPRLAPQPTAIPLLGEVGVAINGLAFFGPNEAAPSFGDPIHNRITDECLGHTAFEYHYHAFREVCLSPDNLISEPWRTAEPGADRPSPLLGFAFDGFAIYGPRECQDASCSEVITLRSSWRRTGDPASNAWDAYTYEARRDPEHLDRCNGHVGPGGDYHYHATESFPYLLGCYAGTPLRQNTMNAADGGTGLQATDAGRPGRDGGFRRDAGAMPGPDAGDAHPDVP